MNSPSLFPNLADTTQAVTGGPFAEVAIEDSLDKLLDYSVPARLVSSLRVGQRVRVPLGRGNRATHGYVVAIKPQSAYPRIKPLFNIDDDRVLLTPHLMELARWMSRYYVAPLGTVIDSVIPAAVKKKVGVEYLQQVRIATDPAAVQDLFEKTRAPKRRAVLARLLQIAPGGMVELRHLARESGVTPATVRKLVKLGIISITPEIDLPKLTANIKSGAGDERDIALNEDQQRVFDVLRPKLIPRDASDSRQPAAEAAPVGALVAGPPAGFSVNLLHGVTGSGKTEIYLQCIREVVRQGRQAIVLVPEIALTPQTVRRFTARFSSVAILHSGLSAGERHRFWQLIAIGHAQVVVGARSAVFAPLPNLGMIVVDEEHEASYKQDSAPRYHGRDVAIKRAQIENVPILLGSATPSLETFWRVSQASRRANDDDAMRSMRDPGAGAAQSAGPKIAPSGGSPDEGKISAIASDAGTAIPSAPPSSVAAAYSLLSLPHRVRGLAMPHVELIDMKQEARMRRGVHLLSQRLEHLLQTTVDAGHQAIILLNRRGYSNFVYCTSCQQVTQCKYCDTTMTYHRTVGADAHDARTAEGLHTGQLHCHYCLAATPLPSKCPQCGKLLSLFGLGTQRVEEEIARKFPKLTFARVDSDTMRSSRDYEALLGRFGRKEIQVMLGTQMIAKGLDYPNVTLVGVISGDTALALPDFRAAERTFQLITQVAGRAGRGDSPGRVVLQTFLPDDPTIGAAIRQDFLGFAQSELKLRREVGLPPYGRMVRIVLRDQEIEKLHSRSEELAAEIMNVIAIEGDLVKMKGPMPCAIARIAGYYRNQIVMSAQTAAPLQRVLAAVREHKHLAHTERVSVDVDPVSLL